MKKIGVFGDSFAINNMYAPDFNDEFNNIDNIDFWEKHVTSWIDLIGAQTYGIGGTDIQYSFLEFGKHHSKYDQVIFVLTEPLRLTLGKEITWHSGMLAERKEKEALEHYEKSASSNDLEMYHTWSAIRKITEVLIPTSQEYVNRQYLFYNLVIERIKQLRPDVKFIKAFPNTDDEFPLIKNFTGSEILNLLNRTVPSSNQCLQDIQYLENTIMAIDQEQNNWPYYDTRVAHLTEESHIILAPLIKKWLKTDEMFFDFDIKEFYKITPNIIKYYTFVHKDYESWKKYYCNDKNDITETAQLRKKFQNTPYYFRGGSHINEK
jgi:hypothetical protein|tara:strand:+ start:3270 stop:4232 length:963 start_codon:yes stop_codon:yes gene_type:complete